MFVEAGNSSTNQAEGSDGDHMLTNKQAWEGAHLPEALSDEAVPSGGVGLLDALVHLLIWHLPEQAHADQRSRTAMH